MTIPNFFIVGAPKCATSALHIYLRRHPDVFLPRYKEPKFFADDLDSGSVRDGEVFVRDLDTYLDLFADAGTAKRVGEASAVYLFSTVAARNIHRFNPDAKIIAMLRNPVEVVYAFHNERVYNGNENITEFREALAAEADRARGRRLPPRGSIHQALQYRKLVRFAEQLERYLELFGRDSVHVIVFDDFKRDVEACYRGVLDFLGLPNIHPESFEVINKRKHHRLLGLGLLLRRPPRPIRKLVGALVEPLRLDSVRQWLLDWNTIRGTRPPLDPELRRSLEAELEPEVTRLGELLGRDLSHWVGQRVPQHL